MSSAPEGQEQAEELWNKMAADDESAASEPEGTPDEPQQPPVEEPNQEAAQAAPEQEAQPSSSGGDDELQQLKRELHRVKSDLGRIRSEKQKLEALVARSPAGPTSEEVRSAMREPEQWEKLKQDYPDIAEGVEALIKARVESMIPSDLVTRRELEQDKARTSYEAELMSIADVNPNWEEEVRTEEFSTWLASQPIEVQALADSPAPALAKRLIELWTNRNAQARKPSVNPRLKAAVQPQRVSSSPRSDTELEGVDYWNFLAAQKRAA